MSTNQTITRETMDTILAGALRLGIVDTLTLAYYQVNGFTFDTILADLAKRMEQMKVTA